MDCTAVPEETTPVLEQASASDPAARLAAGEFAAACEAARRARRRASGDRPPAELVLLECDALAALGRDAEAVAVASRALSRLPPSRDHVARLRVARSLALWHAGRVAAACAEARRALEQSEEPLTRGRVLEALGLFAWKDDEMAQARDLLAQALALYEAGGSAAGVVRAAGLAAEVERETWRFAEALALHDRRTALAGRLGRAHVLADVHVDRASLLAAIGHWDEAARALDGGAGAGVAATRREPLAAGLVRATLAQARGDLVAARRALAEGRQRLAGGARPRTIGEWQILASDLALAAGDAAAAEQEAVEALRLFGLAGERSGRCRGRVRRAQALLGLGREAEAVVEARRAAADAGVQRPDLRALAGVAMARALTHTRPAAAEALCAKLAERSEAHPGFLAVARFGQALAGGATDAVLAERLAELEAWGDRRVLSYCLAELRSARPPRPVADAGPAEAPPTRGGAGVDPLARALVEAVHGLAGEGSWPDRWAAAVRALTPVVPWHRAAHVGAPGLELRRDDEHARPLAGEHLARLLAERIADRPAVVTDLRASPELVLHPARALHGLRAAVVAPAAAGAALYFDFREDQALPSDRQVAAIVELGRLLARFPADPPAAQAGEVTVTGLVGESAPMKALVRTIDRIARSEAAVHICGETGTGKERVAQALHQRSPRAAKPFVAVNASSLGDELFESEMFGHLRGSFTGAVGDREGHVAAAEGGTLFLDEVTDLSPRGQAKLLRLLEQKEYRRVGESRLRHADVRFVTASNVALEQRVAEGRFREDLMYRLNHMVVAVPPLRERGDDVARLARHFLRRTAARERVPVPLLSPDAERALRLHAWPGNVRELENEMDRLVVMNEAGPIRRADLAPAIVEPPARGAASLREAVRDFERAYITQALRRHGNNRARTACLLGLTRQGLVAKISRLGIGSQS